MTSSCARLLSLPIGFMLVSLFASTGCNFIFNPEKSDEVIRCKNTTECEREEFFSAELRKQRADAVCAAPGGGGGFTTSKTNQVCSLVDKASVSCSTEALPISDFADAVDAATMNEAVYTRCLGDKQGTLGCAALSGGTCAAGLKPNQYGVCDDGKGQPLIEASEALKLQDVKDQHCRSYFCDDSFVCNSKINKCIRCNEDFGTDRIGQGACGELAINGARSTIYLPQETLEDECPDYSRSEKTQFGPAVTVPEMP